LLERSTVDHIEFSHDRQLEIFGFPRGTPEPAAALLAANR